MYAVAENTAMLSKNLEPTFPILTEVLFLELWPNSQQTLPTTNNIMDGLELSKLQTFKMINIFKTQVLKTFLINFSKCCLHYHNNKTLKVNVI